MLSQNEILEVTPGLTASFDGMARVVAVSEDGATTALVRLDLQRPYAPFNRPTALLVQDIDAGRLRRVQTFDPNLPASVHELKEGRERSAFDRAVALMQPLFGEPRYILDSDLRGLMFRQIAQQNHVADRTVRRHFYSYLWGGLTDLALAGPRHDPKAPKRRQAVGTAKRGPKPKQPDRASATPLPEIREALEKGAKLYYLPGKHTQFEAWVLTLNDFFSKGKKATKDPMKGVVLEDILLPTTQLPSFAQFRYVCSQVEATVGPRQARPRQSATPKTTEPQRGKARAKTHGPGFRFEIDASRVQIRLVSRYSRRNLVREATLYIIIDVWSGAYVGYVLSLEPASWALATQALRNCFTNKSEVFRRLGLPYSNSDWVANHLPSRLAADRAELVSNKAGVVPELGIKVEIMASMRPDRKGTVEGKIGALKHCDNFYQKPGRHAKNPQRRQSDGKKDAAFTLDELERLIVQIIIDLNNEPVPVANIPAEALQDGRSAITYGGLFEWGLNHRPGFTRILTPKQIFTGLLLKGTGNVTSAGISFRKQNFVAQELSDLGLQQRAITKGAFSIELRYEDHFGGQIWFLNPVARDWTLAINDNEDAARLRASFWEIEEFLQTANHLILETKTENVLRKRRNAEELNELARRAQTAAKHERAGRTTTQNKSQISANTAVEVEANRILQAKATQAAFASASHEVSKILQSTRKTPSVNSAEGIPQPKAVGPRALELWKKKNADMDK